MSDLAANHQKLISLLHSRIAQYRFKEIKSFTISVCYLLTFSM